MEDAQKQANIDAKRSTLEVEQHSAQLDVKLAKKSKHEELLTEPTERLAEIDAKLKVLDDEEKSLG